MARKLLSMGSLLSLCLALGFPTVSRAQTIVNQTVPIPRMTSVPVPPETPVVRAPVPLGPYMTSINYPLIYGSYAMFPYAIPPSFTSGGSISSSVIDLSMRPNPLVRRAYSPVFEVPAATARITVITPKGADVWFQGMQVPMSGTVKKFSSPELNPALTYTYDVRAMWRENGQWVNQTQRVLVRAGDDLTLTFAPTPASELPRPSSAPHRSPGETAPRP